MLEDGIPNQFLITGYRGIGKTSLLKKLLKNLPDKFLTTYIDLSDIYGRQKGKLSEEEVIKEFLCLIEESLENNDKIVRTAKEKLYNTLNLLKLNDYNFSSTYKLNGCNGWASEASKVATKAGNGASTSIYSFCNFLNVDSAKPGVANNAYNSFALIDNIGYCVTFPINLHNVNFTFEFCPID